MYIPTITRSLKDLKFPQIRLGLQGAPATGKTHSALTFPNVIVLDTDKSLTEHTGKDIPTFPMWDPDYVCSLNNGAFKPKHQSHEPNVRDAVLWLLKTECRKLTAEQTLLLDSWTSLQNYFDTQTGYFPKMGRDGSINDYAFWGDKIDYSKDIVELLKKLACHVIVTFHEFQKRDPKTQQLLEKVGPLMQGQFVAQLAAPFTDFFRTLHIGEKDGKDEKYVWQVRSDNQFNAKTRLTKIPDGVKFVEPDFKIFAQYGYTMS